LITDDIIDLAEDYTKSEFLKNKKRFVINQMPLMIQDQDKGDKISMKKTQALGKKDAAEDEDY